MSLGNRITRWCTIHLYPQPLPTTHGEQRGQRLSLPAKYTAPWDNWVIKASIYIYIANLAQNHNSGTFPSLRGHSKGHSPTYYPAIPTITRGWRREAVDTNDWCISLCPFRQEDSWKLQNRLTKSGDPDQQSCPVWPGSLLFAHAPDLFLERLE